MGTYAVGTTDLTLDEPAPGSGEAPRLLPTTIWYPRSSGRPGGLPDRADGPFPLLVFSQGFLTPVLSYETLLRDWASAGYVVSAPTYPETDPVPTTPATLTTLNKQESDIVNHPRDLQFVIDAIVAKAGRPGWSLSGMVADGEVGVVGQSDGGDVSLAVAANTVWYDPEVKAVAVLSGAEFADFGGSYFSVPHLPILVVQSNADSVNVPACSVQIYNSAPGPKYYLDLLGPTGLPPWDIHLAPYTRSGEYLSVVAAVTIDFFDTELAGDAAAAADMAGAGSVAGVAQFSSGPAAPTPPGACPTAP
ncbi:MAG: alpha/beta hydrolase family protein [Acidimicrobiales bacterium]